MVTTTAPAADSAAPLSRFGLDRLDRGLTPARRLSAAPIGGQETCALRGTLHEIAAADGGGVDFARKHSAQPQGEQLQPRAQLAARGPRQLVLIATEELRVTNAIAAL